MGELSHTLSQAKLGRYHSILSCGVRPDRYSELIVHLCMFRIEVRDRYPNADEAYLAIDIFDHHSPELRRARMRKLLDAGLPEYWTLDIVEQSLTTYRESSGRVVQTKYNRQAKVPLDSFPDIEIDLRELLNQDVTPERAKDIDHNHPTGQE